MYVILYVVASLSLTTGTVAISRTIWEGSLSDCNQYAAKHKERLKATDARIWCRRVYLKDPEGVSTFNPKELK
jgi:hypothetical protein